MKIAIHMSRKQSYSENWIAYCEEKHIPYKIVNCYGSDIMQQLSDCDALMWHFHQASSKDAMFAKQLLFSVQASGKKVFPNFNTCWHFDDKVGQKYLFEAINAPLVPSYVFYSKAEAMQWAMKATFPKVFKLRGGAGSANVRLVRTKIQAMRLIKKAFGNGFRQHNPWSGLKERWRMRKMGKSNIIDILEGLGRLVIKTGFEKVVGKEKGYVYFQDFIEGCTFDIRVKVIVNKCWAFKRLIRENDFRASGSNRLVFSSEGIPQETIKIALDISKKLHLQCVAFDFILSEQNTPLITEMSYAFGFDEGENYAYWDSEMNWHEGIFNPFGWMVENMIRDIQNGGQKK
jgi:glutathione synthase/RimK-type ligase-like ATP-grasp enzyme